MSSFDTSLAKDNDFLNAGVEVVAFEGLSLSSPESSSLCWANNGPRFSFECFIATLFLNLDARDAFTGVCMPGVEGISMPGEQGHGDSGTPLELRIGELKFKDRIEEAGFTGVAAGDCKPAWQADPGSSTEIWNEL